MSEPWTCPSCGFEWVVPVGGECLSCGYTSGGAREEQSVQQQREASTLLQTTIGRDDPLAPLYPPGAYPPPVEETPVVNGESPRGMADPRPLDRQPSAPVSSQVQEMQMTFLQVMTAAKARLDALQHELSIQEQQVKEAVAAESEVRASLEEWHQRYTREQQENMRSREVATRQQGQLTLLAEANQQLRQEQAKGLGSTRPGMTPPAEEGQPLRRSQWHERRVDVLEKQLGQMSTLLDTIVQRLDREQVPSDAPDPEAYSTFITTDSQAARVEQEILRNQAQYNQPWRG